MGQFADIFSVMQSNYNFEDLKRKILLNQTDAFHSLPHLKFIEWKQRKNPHTSLVFNLLSNNQPHLLQYVQHRCIYTVHRKANQSSILDSLLDLTVL